MTSEQREMNIRRLRSIVRKTPDNAIDNVKIMKSDLFKLYSIAGLIDQKYNKNLDSMSKEEKLKAQDAINAAHLPADIVISDTVPIKNIDIDLNEQGNIATHRILMFDKKDWIPLNYDGHDVVANDILNNASFDVSSMAIVGAVVIFIDKNDKTKDKSVTIPIIYVTREGSTVLAIEATDSYIQFANRFIPFGTDREADLRMYKGCELAVISLNIWYAIEVSLLNPLIDYRTVKNQVVERAKTRNGKKKHGSQKIKYYKTIYIEGESLDQFFEEQKNEKGEIHRHCLMWYVTGHWRQYKDGKRIFIQGYWKGEGRFSGIEAQTRDRELVLEEDDLPKERIQKPKEPARRLFVDPSYYEKVRCECGQCVGTDTDHVGERCDVCHTLIMYRG